MMNIFLSYGTKIVIFALIAYSIAIITEQRKHRVSNSVLIFITSGIILDITATVLMIIGSSNTPFTLHGFIGYSSLAAMLVDTVLIWKHRFTTGQEETVPKSLHLYSRYAYSWWVIAFITGGLLVLFK
jgi:EamA domain-containing membrane protein RarD